MFKSRDSKNWILKNWNLKNWNLKNWISRNLVPELWYLNLVPELLGLGVLGYSDPLGLGVPDCLLLGVRGVLGVLGGWALVSGPGKIGFFTKTGFFMILIGIQGV